MELTIEQALQQGIAAHKEGKHQEAESLYRAIIQSQPTHPDANHNLGVLAVSMNKADAAILLFKTALESNPKIEQFWISYVDALIKTEKFDEARQAIADAKQAGIPSANLQIFEEQLQSELFSNSDIPQQEFGNQLKSHQDELSAAIELREIGRYKEAQEWLSNVIEHDSKNSEALSLLSQVLLLDKKEAEAERVLTEAASINSELTSVYYNQARLLLKQSKAAEALEKAQLGYKQSPEEPESLLVLAACLRANKRDLEALPLIEKILKAKSNYAEAYANRALIKLRAKDIVGAIEDAEMTVSLKPHLTQMWQLLSSLYYQANNLSDAIEALRSAHKNEPENPDFMVQLGEFLRQDNKASEAINFLEKATELAPKDAKAWTNLGVAFQQEKKIADAKTAYEKVLDLNPKSAAILSNLGTMKKEAEEWESALQYFEKALELEPNLTEAHSNLGVTLQELGRLDEAEASFRQAIALKPDLAGVHYNLGNTLKELGRLDDAEASYNQAIALKPDYAEAHSNLGNTLQELGRLDEAEASCIKAIALKPDLHKAHFVLGVILYSNGDIDAGIESCARAYDIDPKERGNELVLSVLRARKAREQNEINVRNISQLDNKVGLNCNPIFLNRVVEPELVASLYEMQSREMDEAKNTPVFGNGKCSLNYDMFKEGSPIIKTLERDLIRLMEVTVKSEIYLQDSFFNIYGAGAGIHPHTHLNKLDRDICLDLAKQKYSLVYYLSVGDQDCSEPGIFKLYEPDEEIFPTDGMIVIIPANRLHSAVYGGKKDRIIIGINFYSL